MMPYGSEWRLCRKIQNTALSQTAVKQYYNIQEDIATLMAKEFLDTPEDFFNLTRLCVIICNVLFSTDANPSWLNFRCASRIVLSITYGLSVKTVDSEV